MSSSESHATVTYTSISSDSNLPPYGFHLIDLDEFEAQQSSEQAPPSPDYVPGLEYPEYVAASDDEIPIKDHPLPADASPTALSPCYIVDSDIEEDPKEDLVDYPIDRGDDDDQEEESSEDDDDDEEKEASKEEEDEEHLASADSVALRVIDLVPSAEETEPFKIDESDATPPPQIIVPISMTRLHRARITVRPHTLTSPSAEALIAEAASPLHVPSPPLLLLATDHMIDIPKADMPSRKRLCLTNLASSIRAYESRVMTIIEEVNEKKMPPKKTTTPVSDATIKQLIAQGVADVLAEHEANRNSRNGDDNHDLESGRKNDDRQVFPRSEIKKLEIEIWNLKVKGTNVCDGIQAKKIQDAIVFATELMDQKICTFADRQAENKRKLYDNTKNNQTQQQPFKKQNVAKAYIVGPGDNKEYGGSLPLCPKCNYHHKGQCALRYNNFKKVGHLACDCRSPVANVNDNNQRNSRVNQRVLTCLECGVQGLYKKDCPKLKNNNRENQAGNAGAQARAYAAGNAGKNSESNVVTGTFLINNRYASILFDTGADRSFVSTAFSSQIDIVPTTLDHDYDVVLADNKIIVVNVIIRGCTLNFLNHPFNIDLMPVELGSFDFINGMDWLSMYHVVTVCDEKIVRIPFGNEILVFCGDGSKNRNESRLNIISYAKTQKYLLKGCHVFLAYVTTKKADDKSEEKRLKYVPIVRDFPEVFPKDFLGIPPTRQVEF
uniref:Reverse transcriptase domain-containing protein n=1 Tax=Tanacetum cinerariifolium TaxID=118510 RepID=A0A699GN66_TANCI|nr:hypothetical protein [Tanacetum cinerariifolium]